MLVDQDTTTTNVVPKTGAENVLWNLNAFFGYSGVTDPKLDEDFDHWCDMAKAFHAAHKGNLKDTLGQSIIDQIALGELSCKISAFLALTQQLNLGDTAVQAKNAQIQRKVSEVSAEYLTFFKIEVCDLEYELITAHAEADPVVKKHLALIDMSRTFKRHLLPEPIEAALTLRSPFGHSSWSEFFKEWESDLRFPWEDRQITMVEIIHILSNDGDQDTRARAQEVLNEGLGGQFGKYAAQALYVVAGAQNVECGQRKYKHPMEEQNKKNRLPDAMVDALHKAVAEEAGPLACRYYKLKGEILEMPILPWSARNAKMPFGDNTFVPWDKAIATVLTAYESFSPTLAGLIREIIAAKGIDALAISGKNPGAFSYPGVLPGGKPFGLVLMNYLGSNHNVMTLAHELGHAVHQLLAGEAQGVLQQYAPIALAETASVFGEMTTFNYLKAALIEKGDKKALLALIMDKISDMMNTVVRQIGFSNFERRLHGWDPETETWKHVSKRSVRELDAIWLETTYELYGKPGEILSYEDTNHLWAFIQHFHSPFYVYGYAVGELVTDSLYAQQPYLGERFEPMYLDLLRAGSSKSVEELLRPFGLDPTDPMFWSKGIEISLGTMVPEAEALAKELRLVG